MVYGNYQISNRVKEILNLINSDEIKSLDYATINFYKNKILNEINRLYCVMPEVPQCAQDEIRAKLIVQLEGAIDTLNSLNPEESTFKTLVRRLDSIRGR